MNISGGCEVANHKPYKTSDIRKLSTQAKVMAALMKNQPQKTDDLCRSAGIHKSTFYRMRRLLMNKRIIKKVEKGYVLRNYVEPTSLWDSLQDSFKQVGGDLVEIALQKASYAGRHQETGWRLFRYDNKNAIRGIMVLKVAPRFVAVARSAGIYIHEKYDGVVLSSDPIRWKDRLWWEGKLYETGEVEDCLDGYHLVGYRIGKLVEFPVAKDHAKASSPDRTVEARKQIRAFLTAGLNDDNITRDDGSTKAAYCVIYTNPNYSILKEFVASNNPVDGVYAIGKPETMQLLGHDQTTYGYEEHVPIFIYTIDKAGVTGERLQSKMEAEIMRVCEKNLIENKYRGRLERRNDTKKRFGSTILYYTEFALNYTRGVNR